MYPQILNITKEGSVAEDILQETFLKVWINRDKLPEIENPRAWVLRIAYFHAFTFLRRQGIHEKAIASISDSMKNAKRQNEAEQMMSFKSLQATIRQAIRELPPQQMKVYQLSRELGLNTKEIATHLNLSEQSVKNTLVRALKFIRGRVNKAGHIIFSLSFILIQWFRR